MIETPASSVTLPLSNAENDMAWRVLRIALDGESYAASSWSPLGPDPDDRRVPRGIVRIKVGPEDADARRFAESMAGVLADNDLLVRIEGIDRQVEATSLRYGFDTDAPLARAIAAILPGLTDKSLETDAPQGRVAGQITISLAGGIASASIQVPASQTSTPASSGEGE